MPNPAETFETLPFDELLVILLKQMKRPLESVGVQVSDDEARSVVRYQIERRGDAPEALARVVTGLIEAVEASEQALATLGLTFVESLDTPMDNVPGWETTAEFLELANEKINAELRITLGAALALTLGNEQRYVPYLEHLAAGDYGDETVIARRMLDFVRGQA